MTRLAFHDLLLPVFVKDILKDLSQILRSYSVGVCICPPVPLFSFWQSLLHTDVCRIIWFFFLNHVFNHYPSTFWLIMLTIYSLNQPCIWLTSPLSLFFQSTAVEWCYCVRAAAADLQWFAIDLEKGTTSFRPVVIMCNCPYTPDLTTVAL